MKFLNFKLIWLTIFISTSFNGTFGANILGLFHIASPSHSIWNNVLIKGLAEKGHNVTVIISDLPKNPKEVMKNVTYFDVNDLYATLYETEEIAELFDISPFQMMQEFCKYCKANCKALLKTKGFKKFMKTYDRNFHFDLVLYDNVCGPCLLGLLEYFNFPPMVAVTAFPYPSFANKFSGGHFHPAYVSYHSANLDIIESYVDRLYNNLLVFSEILLKKFSFYPEMNEMVESCPHYPKKTKTLSELEQYVTISIVNSHPAICAAEPLPPNVIEVGGLQLVDPDPLEIELENFVSSAKKGAIFFSLGTNVAPTDYSEENIKIIISTIKKFSNYNFLWKFDASLIKGEIPKNLLIKSFFPQRDILAHKNTKAFITHGGGLSTQESIWYGVPMLGFPLFADQIRNIKDIVSKKIGIEANFNALTQKDFDNALHEILENKMYYENIRLMSQRFRDRKEKPLDKAIWWIEYILRNPTPDHLKPKSLNMNYFSANSFDFVILVFLILQVILASFIYLLCLCCCKSKKSNANVPKKLKTK